MVNEKPYGKIKIFYYSTIAAAIAVVGSFIGKIVINGMQSSIQKQGLGFWEKVSKFQAIGSWWKFFNIAFIIGVTISIILLIISLVYKADSDVNYVYNKRIMAINAILMVLGAIVMMIGI